MNELEARLRQGVALHRQGRLDDAAHAYNEILEQQPDHFEALRLLGVAALQSKRADLGLRLIRQAIKANDTIVAGHATLGNALRDLGRREEALASYDKAVALDPGDARTWYQRGNILLAMNRAEPAAESFASCIALTPDIAEAWSGRGNALAALGRLEDALAAFDRAITLKPDFAVAHYNRGNALLQSRRFPEALDSHDQAIALRPNFAEAHGGRGNALWELKRPNDALDAYGMAISMHPGFAEAYSNRANALRDLKRFEEALESCDVAIRLHPDLAQAHQNRGNALMDLKRPEEAVASYDRAISLNPAYARAYFNRANALLALTRRQEALASFDNAIALRPDDVPAYSNRGNVRLELANIEDAVRDFDTAIALQPDYAPAHCNRGNAMMALLRLDEAAACFRTAISLRPDYVDAHWNDGLRLLLTGQFGPGWRAYEWRKKLTNPVADRLYPQPLWLGEQGIAGKVLFVHWEQGLGDTIQFCRYAKLAEARGATVIMEVPATLRGLLTQLSPTIRVIVSNEDPGPFDYHCPLMSLPLAFRTTMDTIPARPGYLQADAAARGTWSARLNGLAPKRPRIGLVWNGSPEHHLDHLRSIALATCLPLLTGDAEWICLQKEIRDVDADARRQAVSLRWFGDAIDDFTDTAALVDLMDLVITVDTSIAHLAGAMGKPVWVMLPYSPDWRWLLDREDSPWYPSAKLFRQPRVGDWDSVIDQVARALRSAAINNPATH